tara:strand:- start:323 stop:544 length:222 start_codon:yes stop_codon:yes gene_type:complete
METETIMSDDEMNKIRIDLAKIETVVAERWKTAFNRFDEIEERLNKLDTYLMSGAAAIILFMAGLIVTLLTIH